MHHSWASVISQSQPTVTSPAAQVVAPKQSTYYTSAFQPYHCCCSYHPYHDDYYWIWQSFRNKWTSMFNKGTTQTSLDLISLQENQVTPMKPWEVLWTQRASSAVPQMKDSISANTSWPIRICSATVSEQKLPQTLIEIWKYFRKWSYKGTLSGRNISTFNNIFVVWAFGSIPLGVFLLVNSLRVSLAFSWTFLLCVCVWGVKPKMIHNLDKFQFAWISIWWKETWKWQMIVCQNDKWKIYISLCSFTFW